MVFENGTVSKNRVECIRNSRPFLKGIKINKGAGYGEKSE